MNEDNSEKSTVRQEPIFRLTEEAMIASMRAAIVNAAENASDENAEIAARLPSDYFARVALHLQFLELCEADLKTSEGGNARTAKRVLHIGRRIASRWDDRGPETPKEADGRERTELSHSAQRAAMKIVVQALVEQASTTDPELRKRISATTDAYLERLNPQSATDKFFAELTRELVSMFAGKAD